MLGCDCSPALPAAANCAIEARTTELNRVLFVMLSKVIIDMAIKLQISFYIILSGFVKGILIMDLLYMEMVAGFVIIDYLYKRLLAWRMVVSVLVIYYSF